MTLSSKNAEPSSLQRTPITAPLPCFGLEHEAVDPECRTCAHEAECLKFMGTRAGKVPLSALKFDLIPAAIKEKLAKIPDDPEAPQLGQLYVNCHLTIFRRSPETGDRPDYYRDSIVKNAREAACSIRLFILANMVAHQVSQHTEIEHGEKGTPTRFRAKQLSSKLAVVRATQYAKLCHDRFGTFALSSLSTLADEDYELDDMETVMLNSEITAGQFVVNYKIATGGPPFEALYQHSELKLNPYWLAIEPSYWQQVLQPHLAKKSGTEAIQRHRFDVLQVRNQLMHDSASRTNAFTCRQNIMPEALRRVLSYLKHRPEDFLYDKFPVQDTMQLWINLGRTIQHYHCYLLLNDEPSYFKA